VDDRVVGPVAHQLVGAVRDHHGVDPVRVRDGGIPIRRVLTGEELRADGGHDLTLRPLRSSSGKSFTRFAVLTVPRTKPCAFGLPSRKGRMT